LNRGVGGINKWDNNEARKAIKAKSFYAFLDENQVDFFIIYPDFCQKIVKLPVLFFNLVKFGLE
jgi:hypothetical protein